MPALFVLNAGSSTIKFGLYDSDTLEPLARGLVDGAPDGLRAKVSGSLAELFEIDLSAAAGHDGQLDWILSALANNGVELAAVGHRVVHGGADFNRATRVDEAVMSVLRELTPFAPAHQPHNLAGIEAVTRRWPSMPQAACFDTAFHRTMPRIAQLFPIPRALSDAGLVRYGFHGLSYQHVAETMRARKPYRRILAAHLGNGASLCGLKDGASVATSMGLTALDGLMMGTRSGAVDPGLVLHLIEQWRLAPADVSDLLNRKSGLLGVSGLSSDMRTLEHSDAPAAHEAIALFAYRAAREAGSIIVALEGLDAIVFTGGIGEHSPRTRAAICERLAFAGVRLNPSANDQNAEIISASDSAIPVHIVPADEELQIARETAALFSASKSDLLVS